MPGRELPASQLALVMTELAVSSYWYGQPDQLTLYRLPGEVKQARCRQYQNLLY